MNSENLQRETESIRFVTVEQAAEDIKNGKMVILVDDEDRENEGDLVIAAEKTTPLAINFMAKEGRGLICLSLSPEKCDQLGLSLMVDKNRSQFQTGFTVSIEAKEGVTTGISAKDRATTILTAIKDDALPSDLVSPGHVFPLRAREGGTLVRVGQTEGSVDLCKIAGLKPAAVICEIMNDDGTMARVNDLKLFAEKHDINILTIKDLVSYRLKNESFVRREAETIIPTDYGDFNFIAYRNIIDNSIHTALYIGDVFNGEPVMTRVHSQCFTGDVFGSKRCDCGEQLHTALRLIKEENRGLILYLFQEGRGIGLVNKIKAYNLQDQGLDTVEANHGLGFRSDLRDYGIGAQILKDLSVCRLHLLTNNPRKIVGLDGYGIKIEKRLPLLCKPNKTNGRYLETKKVKLGHLIDQEIKKG